MPESVKLHQEDWCYVHNKNCVRIPCGEKDGQLKLKVSGTPCPDWSNFGKHGRDGGPTAPATIVETLGLQLQVGRIESRNVDTCSNSCVDSKRPYHLSITFSLSCFTCLYSDPPGPPRMKSVKQTRPHVYLHENVIPFPPGHLAVMLGRPSRV